VGSRADIDHSPPPVLYALAACHRQGEVPFAPPGYQQDRGADQRVLPVLEKGVFRSDVLVAGGLDGRRSSAGLVQWAEQPMADAIGAEQNVLLDVRQEEWSRVVDGVS